MESPGPSSPFKSVIETVGPKHEKALKHAFYNTAALVFLVLSVIIVISAYYVLEIFLRPLIWAALCGTFLYPFKKAATASVRGWLNELQFNNTPFFIGVTVLPFTAVNRSADGLGELVKSNYKLLTTVFLLVPCSYYLVVFHPFGQIFAAFALVFGWLAKVLSFFNYPYLIWSFFIGYTVLLFFYNDSNPILPEYIFKSLSAMAWIMVSFHLVSLAGTWSGPLALLLFVLILVGVVGEIRNKLAKTDCTNAHQRSFSVKQVVDQTLLVFGMIPNKSLSDHTLNDSNSDANNEKEAAPKIHPNVEALKTSTPILYSLRKTLKHGKTCTKKKRNGTSDAYFICLFWLFVISRVWMHVWIIEMLPLLLAVYIFKVLYSYFEFRSLYKKLQPLETSKQWFNEREHIILPRFIKRVLHMLQAGDQKVISWTHVAMDKLMALFIILFLIVAVILAAAFFSLQVHHESSYLLDVATDVVNKTVISNQEYLRYLNLNDSDVRKNVDAAIHGAFLYGRGKVSGLVGSAVSGDNSNSTLVAEQVDEFLVQLYDAWTEMNVNTSVKESLITNATKEVDTQGFFKYHLQKAKSLLSYSDLTNIWILCKENIQTLQSVFDSVWSIIKGNLSLMFSIVTHVISLVFLSGTFLFNVIISTVIFITTLFYLLSASSDQYKLVEWLTGVSMGTRLGESINNAISDVFGASFKMATFYGFYTWLTHSVFGANLVFIPAALASTLGVVPFIGTYWAAVPAAFELWLIQNNGGMAILLLLLHMLPTYVVDTAIYSEIAGGHPYLTGLAVAGGVYCIGLEGAFVGPFVLCCLIAAFDVYSGIMNNSDDASPVVPIPKFRRAMSTDVT